MTKSRHNLSPKRFDVPPSYNHAHNDRAILPCPVPVARPTDIRDPRRGHVDRGQRGLYSTDASLYQIEPVGVVVPRTVDDVIATVRIAAEEKVAIVPRRGHQPLGADRRRRDRDRLLEVPQSDRHRRPRRDDGAGRAGGGARPAQRPPETAGADVRARTSRRAIGRRSAG